MSRRTVDDIRRRHLRRRHHEHAAHLRALADMPEWTFVTSLQADCLTHVFRYAYDWRDTRWPRVSVTTQCGQAIVSQPVPTGDVSFVCARCLVACDVYGIELPVEFLIPDNGCAVSGGRRRGRPTLAEMRERSTR